MINVNPGTGLASPYPFRVQAVTAVGAIGPEKKTSHQRWQSPHDGPKA